MTIYYIYTVEHLESGKQYIGQTDNPKRRWKEHRGCGKSTNTHLRYAIKKYGVEAFIFVVNETTYSTLTDIDDAEMAAISAAKLAGIELYNISYGGGRGDIEAAVTAQRSRSPEQKSAAAKKRAETMGPIRLAEAGKNRAKTMGKDALSASMKKAKQDMGYEKRCATAKKRVENTSPEQRREAAKKRMETMGPERMSDAMKKRAENMSTERRSEIAQKRMETMGPEKRSAAAKKRAKNMGPERMSDAMKKGWETRRKNKELSLLPSPLDPVN